MQTEGSITNARKLLALSIPERAASAWRHAIRLAQHWLREQQQQQQHDWLAAFRSAPSIRVQCGASNNNNSNNNTNSTTVTTREGTRVRAPPWPRPNSGKLTHDAGGSFKIPKFIADVIAALKTK